MTNEELLTKIRAEIESRIKELHEAEIDYRLDQCDAIVSCLVSAISELQRVLTLLNTIEKSLPTKVKDNKELEMEIERVVTEYKEKVFGTKVMKPSGVEKIARSFYDLGCRRTAEKYDEIEYNRQREEENVQKDLEEAADEYAEKHGFRVPYDGSNNFYDEVDVKASKEGFIAGAEWQKERDEMSKVNYEGARAVYDNTIQHLQEKMDEKYELGKQAMKEQMMEGVVEGTVHNFSSYMPRPTVLVEAKGFSQGDKVRVIILPKED
jgi:flagellar biosynthesis chaperone FliJ